MTSTPHERAAGADPAPGTTADPAPDTTLLARLTHPAVRASALVVLVVAATVVGLRSDGIGVEALQEAFADLGLLGPLLFAAVYAVAAALLVPASPFTLAAGLLFGPVLGSATALVGATVGATGAFLLGRGLGREAVERFGGRRLAALDRHLATRGFVSLLLIRLVPLFPFNLVNVGSGVTGLRLGEYVLATAVGIVPGTIAYAALGGTITDPTSPAFLGAIAIFVVVTVVAGLAARRMRATEAVGQAVR
jgi:uncharacterized membrane protein YdjX (TVP38/TMEM64 family)